MLSLDRDVIYDRVYSFVLFLRNTLFLNSISRLLVSNPLVQRLKPAPLAVATWVRSLPKFTPMLQRREFDFSLGQKIVFALPSREIIVQFHALSLSCFMQRRMIIIFYPLPEQLTTKLLTIPVSCKSRLLSLAVH